MDALGRTTEVPELADALNVPSSEPAGLLVATNLVRLVAFLGKGSTNVPADLMAVSVPWARDLVRYPSVGEIRTANGKPSEWYLGIQGSHDSSALGRLAGAMVVAKTNGWTLGASSASEMKRAVVAAVQPRKILEASFDLAQWGELAPWSREYLSLAKGNISVTATNKNLRTEMQLDFAEALPFQLTPWKLPSTIAHDPIISFTAIRGIESIVKKTPWQRDFGNPEVINQLFLWANPRNQFQTLFAAPVSDPDQFVEQVAAALKPYFPTPESSVGKLAGGFFHDQAGHKLLIRGPGIMPALLPVRQDGSSWVHGGFFPAMNSTNPLPAALVQQLDRKDLMAFDWEVTSENLQHWLVIHQAMDILLRKPLIQADGPIFRWLDAAGPKLQNSVTEVLLVNPRRLELTRKSTVGLSSYELVRLARWLDAPISTRSPFQVPGGSPTIPSTKKATGASR